MPKKATVEKPPKEKKLKKPPKSPKPKLPFCGIGNLPTTKRYGTMRECLEKNKVNYWGLHRIDPHVVKHVSKAKLQTKHAANALKKENKVDKAEVTAESKEAIKWIPDTLKSYSTIPYSETETLTVKEAKILNTRVRKLAHEYYVVTAKKDQLKAAVGKIKDEKQLKILKTFYNTLGVFTTYLKSLKTSINKYIEHADTALYKRQVKLALITMGQSMDVKKIAAVDITSKVFTQDDIQKENPKFSDVDTTDVKESFDKIVSKYHKEFPKGLNINKPDKIK